MQSEESLKRLIRQTLLKIQIPARRKVMHSIIQENKDMGKEVEWSAPVQRAVIGRTIEIYENEFEAKTIGTDEKLNEIVDFIAEKLFTTDKSKAAIEE